MSNIPDNLRKVLEKLTFIASIEKGKRINVNYRPTIVGSGSWWYSWYESWNRSMHGESRENTINYIGNN